MELMKFGPRQTKPFIQPWWLGSLGRYSRIQLKSTFWRSMDRITLWAKNTVANAPAVYVRWNCNMYICKL